MVRKAPRRVRIRNPLSGKHRAPHYSSSGTAGKTASLTTPPNTEPSKTWASRHDRGSFRVVIAPRLPRQAPPAALPSRTLARRLAVRAGPRRCFPCCWEGSSGGLDRELVPGVGSGAIQMAARRRCSAWCSPRPVPYSDTMARLTGHPRSCRESPKPHPPRSTTAGGLTQGNWWDVPVAEVSDLDFTRAARETYDDFKATQRPLL